MKKIQLKERVMNYLGIALGSIFYAAGVVLFLQPNNMVAGGVGGLSVVIDHYTGIPSGTWVLLLNVPLLILAWWKLGFEYFLNTLLAVGISSVFMNAMLPLNDLLEKGALTTDPFLAAATGGALIALGLGVVFRARGTTGGSDIVARLLKMK